MPVFKTMNLQIQRRSVLFELALVFGVLVMGGTAFWVYQLQSQLEQNYLRLDELSTIQNEYFENEYFQIGERVRLTISDLQALLGSIRQKGSLTVASRFDARSKTFSEWLDRQKNRPEWERFRSEKLKQQVAQKRLVRQNKPLLVSKDLVTLIEQIDAAYRDYALEAQSVIRNAGAPLANEVSRAGFERASRAAQQLFNLAHESTQSSLAIKQFLKTQHPAHPRRMILYAILLALFTVVLMLIVALRWVALAPLQMKVIESNTILEQQNKLAHFGQLAAGLAHEIRNPLTAINARLYTLQKKMSDGTTEFNDASVIRGEIQRLDRIVQDFLKLARPADPKLVPMSAEPLLRAVRDLLAPECESRSIPLKIESVTDALFRADEQQLKQVLINLVQNAADSFNNAGGTITLRAKTDKTKLRGRETEVVILEVQDSGSGIPLEVQERLFDPFFSTKEQGTGLGLSIAARIVDKHGGALKFETKLNAGTTFGIVLPRLHSS